MNTINLEHLIINNKNVIVIGSATSFANETRMNFTPPKELIKTLNDTLKIARSKGVKVRNQKRTKDALLALSVSTPTVIDEYNALFDQCIEFWTKRVDMESKTIPDYVYDDCKEGYEIRNKMMAMFHRFRPLDELCSITRRINDLKDSVSRQSDDSSLIFSL